MTTTINESENESLKEFRAALLKTCDNIIAQKMNIINLLERQQVHQQK